jgi:hypothetical protein
MRADNPFDATHLAAGRARKERKYPHLLPRPGLVRLTEVCCDAIGEAGPSLASDGAYVAAPIVDIDG